MRQHSSLCVCAVALTLSGKDFEDGVSDREQVEYEREEVEEGEKQEREARRDNKHITSWMTCGWSETRTETPWATIRVWSHVQGVWEKLSVGVPVYSHNIVCMFTSLDRFFKVPAPSLRLSADSSSSVFWATAFENPALWHGSFATKQFIRPRASQFLETRKVKYWRSIWVHAERCSTTWRSEEGTHQSKRPCLRESRDMDVATAMRKRGVHRDDGVTLPKVRYGVKLLQWPVLSSRFYDFSMGIVEREAQIFSSFELAFLTGCTDKPGARAVLARWSFWGRTWFASSPVQTKLSTYQASGGLHETSGIAARLSCKAAISEPQRGPKLVACGRGAGTHGGVLNVHTEAFFESTHGGQGVIVSSAYQNLPT